ncbi:MAG: GAF domain-containing protein, partial [Nitrospiraceae bacterium]
MKGTSTYLPKDIGILLVLAVVISILGMFLSRKATNTSIASVEGLHERLNSIIEITKQIRTTPFLDVLLEQIVRSAIRLNSAETGSLLLYDDPEQLKFKVTVGKGSKKIKDKIVKRGEGISGWVATKGEPVIINDVSNDDRYTSDFDKETGFTTRSAMCVPLVYDKETIGVIEVLNKKNGIFTKEDERLLSSLADQAAISISHSKVSESRQSDLIQITSILVETQDYFSQVKKGHARNVANYSNLIGKKMGFSEEDLKNLHYASLFHDIGFLRLNISIPLKPDEIEQVKKHPQLGYEIIRPLSLWKEAAELILYHHERFDGNGYPQQNKGHDIPLGARIIFIADTFDVLTSNASYKEQQISFKEAVSEIEAHAGTQFDPEVVEAFKSAMIEAELII